MIVITIYKKMTSIWYKDKKEKKTHFFSKNSNPHIEEQEK